MHTVSSLYIHVPFCRHLCNYCDFYKHRFDASSDQLTQFHEYLRQSWQRHEIIMQQQSVSWAPLETLYFGGGTPSLWDASGAAFFADSPIGQLDRTQLKEWTLEADPGAWSDAGLKAWRALGVNRLSLGVQSMDTTFLKIMDRAHTKNEALELLQYAKDEHWNFSVDFLLGLPHSQKYQRDILRELAEIMSFGPSHISLYILGVRSHYPLKDYLPDDEWSAHEYMQVSEYLRGHGMHHYEVSNFAFPQHEAIHNQRYWQGQNVAALGPSGTGYFAHGPHKAYRYKWKAIKADVEVESLGQTELNIERPYLRLRTSDLVRPQDLANHSSEWATWERLFFQWSSQGYMERSGEFWRMKPEGFLVLDSLMDDIFRQLS